MQIVEEKVNGRDIVVSSKPVSVIEETEARLIQVRLKDGRLITDLRCDIIGSTVLLSVVSENGKDRIFLDKMEVK